MATAINQSNSWYHTTGGTARTAWIEGGARKGTSAGQTDVGLIRFDVGAIAGACENGNPPAAKLMINREAGTGEADVDIAIAPALVTGNSPESMTQEECLELALRDLHHLVTVSGAECAVKLPGAWLDLMARGRINAILVYKEDEEGTEAIARFRPDAQLVIEAAGSFMPPVWVRPVGKGDIISDRIRSHRADLYEIQYYLNIRREIQELQPADIDSGFDVGLYADWYGVITYLRGKMDEVIDAEEGDAISWCSLDPDELPSAQAVNELRNALSSYGPEEMISITSYGWTYFDHLNTDFKVNRDSPTRWGTTAPKGGMCWQYEMRKLNPDDAEPTKVKVYMRRFGVWLLHDLIQGKTVNRLTLSVGRDQGQGGNQTISVYPAKVPEVPAARTSVNSVIDRGVVCGSGSAAVGGQLMIDLTPEAISAIRAGDYYGVGVDDQDAWTNYSASATLIINRTED